MLAYSWRGGNSSSAAQVRPTHHSYRPSRLSTPWVAQVISHGRDEILALAARADIAASADVNGWHVDVWRMNNGDVDASAGVYTAVLGGGATDPVVAMLVDSGLDLEALLLDEDKSREEITRSDMTELIAAASLVAEPGCDIDKMQMPNVPKMSRRKSDSGIDIAVVEIRKDANDDEDLSDGEYLIIASVKHTIGNSSGDMRRKLAESLSSNELGVGYLTSQLRVLNARLQQGGLGRGSAARVYLFIRDFPHPERVHLYAIGVADPTLESDLRRHIQLLPDAGRSRRTFRMIFVPALKTIHERCL
jgi:hypothetical protein